MPFIPSEPSVKNWLNACSHREHNPPGMIVLKPGRHVWECPGCHAQQTIIVREVTLQV
jgi:hypothetical protein